MTVRGGPTLMKINANCKFPYTKYTGLTREEKTQSAQVYYSIWTHRVICPGQVPEHTEYSGLARNNKTLSALDWLGT